MERKPKLLKYKTNKTAAACLKRTTDITHDNLIEILDINWDIKRCMSKAKDLVLGLKGPFLLSILARPLDVNDYDKVTHKDDSLHRRILRIS